MILREAPFFTHEEFLHDEQKVINTLSERYPAVVVENLGVFAAGRSSASAFDRLEVSEFSARAMIESLKFGSFAPISANDVKEIICGFNLPQ
jgi:L-fuculose-phosphate aldolase